MQRFILALLFFGFSEILNAKNSPQKPKVVAPSYPLKLSTTQNRVWISNPQVLDIKTLDSHILIHPKGEGHAHIYGVKENSQTETDFIQVYATSDKNFRKLLRCKQEFTHFSEVQFFGPHLECRFTSLIGTSANRLLLSDR